jgi:predicted nucleic acid-binding protein
LKRTVLDASVALKWYLGDEEHGQKALCLLDDYVGKKLDIIAPTLLEYELTNGLTIAQKRGRIEEEKILKAIEGFMDLQIPMQSLTDFYPKLLHYCRTYGRSVYDASYLALAESEGIMLITADEVLYRAVKKTIAWVRWLGDL